jgi:hypothetical protein
MVGEPLVKISSGIDNSDNHHDILLDSMKNSVVVHD